MTKWLLRFPNEADRRAVHDRASALTIGFGSRCTGQPKSTRLRVDSASRKARHVAELEVRSDRLDEMRLQYRSRGRGWFVLISSAARQ